MEELDQLAKFKTPKGVFLAYLCPVCEGKFKTEDEAVACMESHDELQAQMIFEMGERFPIEIMVRRVEGKKMTQVGYYKKIKVEDIP